MAQWKRYPNRRGAARIQAYYTEVEVVDRETRQVPKLKKIDEMKSERVVIDEEWAKIRINGRLKWIVARELVSD